MLSQHHTVSHQLEGLVALCPRVRWIKNGRLIQDGPAKGLRFEDAAELRDQLRHYQQLHLLEDNL